MRIDKFLWCIRVFKTRTLAAEQCKLGKVWVNNELVKPSREVKISEVLKVRKGPLHFSYRVEAFPTSRVGAKLVSQFATDVTPKEEYDKLEILKAHLAAERPHGLGRPTKRDRRSLDEFLDGMVIDED